MLADAIGPRKAIAFFAVLFLLLPTMNIVLGAFRTPAGDFTFANIGNLFQPSILSAYWISIRISVASALLGCIERLQPDALIGVRKAMSTSECGAISPRP